MIFDSIRYGVTVVVARNQRANDLREWFSEDLSYTECEDIITLRKMAEDAQADWNAIEQALFPHVQGRDMPEILDRIEKLRNAELIESPWKTLSRERWDEIHGEGDYDRLLTEARGVGGNCSKHGAYSGLRCPGCWSKA